ncbi:hypothetical protein GCM10009855_01820 [Gordonia cholesterolivorans]|uniref:Uncharacterized protein n=1 Tax=Gordonia cholesterolivorans TaxID=559625 RepID=A0ABN3H2N7_9ACTN
MGRVRDAGLAGHRAIDAHQPGEQLDERTDCHRVEHGADPEGAAESEPDRHHCDFQDGSDHAHRPSRPRNDPGHQAVARPGAEPCADVQRGGEAVEDDAAQHHGDRDREPGAVGQVGGDRVEGQAEDHHVRHGAHAGPLSERKPCEQDHRTDDDRHRADREAHLVGDSLMQDIPGDVAESGVQDHRHRSAVEHEADGECEESLEHETTVAETGH